MRKLSFGLTIAMLIMAIIILPVGVSNIILACGGNRQWQNHYLRNWAANTKGKGII